MKNAFFRKVGKGFTLIELLVVIAIIAILAAILVPAVQNALFQGRLTTVVNNGRNIYVSLFARGLENPLNPEPAWPQQEGEQREVLDGNQTMNYTFSDSTEFWKWVVGSGTMNVDFSFFAAPGMPSAQTTDEDDFEQENNAWAVALGVSDSTKDGAPVLFTANITATGGNHLQRIDDEPFLDGPVPFGEKGGVVVLNGGSAFTVKKDTLTTNSFNSVGADNECMYPEP